MQLVFYRFFTTIYTFLRNQLITVANTMLPMPIVLKKYCPSTNRSSHPGVFLGKGVLKIYSKFTGEHPCRSSISMKLHATLLKSHFGMGVPVNLLHIFRTPFLKNTSGGLFLNKVSHCVVIFICV